MNPCFDKFDEVTKDNQKDSSAAPKNEMKYKKSGDG